MILLKNLVAKHVKIWKTIFQHANSFHGEKLIMREIALDNATIATQLTGQDLRKRKIGRQDEEEGLEKFFGTVRTL
jgi:hypothetical protein